MATERRRYRLREICSSITSGGTPDTGNPAYWGGGIPWLSSGETRSRYIRKTDVTITQAAIQGSSTRLAKAGDTVVAAAGQGRTRGQTSFLLLDTYINQSVVALRANPELLDERFLFFLVSSKYNELRKLSDAFSSRGSLTTKLLGQLEVDVPPLREQQRIAAILGAIDDKAELNQLISGTLEAVARTVFHSWFVDFRAPDARGLSQSSLGPIPAGWSVARLGDVCAKIFSGGTPSTLNAEYWNGGIPWLSSGETRWKFVVATQQKITEAGVHNSSTRLARRGATVIAGAGQGRTRGQASMLLFDSYVNQSVVALEANFDLISDAYLFFDLERRYEQFRKLSDAHSSRGSLTTKLLAQLPVVVPPRKIVEAFDKIAYPAIVRIGAAMRESDTLRSLRDILVTRFLSGAVNAAKEQSIVEAA